MGWCGVGEDPGVWVGARMLCDEAYAEELGVLIVTDRPDLLNGIGMTVG